LIIAFIAFIAFGAFGVVRCGVRIVVVPILRVTTAAGWPSVSRLSVQAHLLPAWRARHASQAIEQPALDP